MKINQETDIVNLWGIPKLRLHLDPSFCLEMIKELRFFGNYPQIAKLMNEPLDKKGSAYTLINFKIRKSGPVGLVYKIGKFLSNNGLKKFHPHNIEPYIRGISVYGMEKSTIKNPKIPFDFTTESGCILISALLHDGGLNKAFVPYYWNMDIKLRKKVFEAAQNIFGVLPSEFNLYSEDARFPRVCGLILACGLGIKTGNKIFTNPHIPEFVFYLEPEKISAFLMQAFDDEGSVSTSNHTIRFSLSIKGKENPPELLIQIRKLLYSLGIKFTKPVLIRKYTVKNDNTVRSTWNIVLTGREDLEIFKEKVNFSVSEKREKLNMILIDIKERHFKWRTVEKHVLNVMNSLESKYGCFTRNMVAKEIERTWGRMQQIFPKLLKEKRIKEISKYSGTKSARFRLQ